uniref:Uncharacterized protein n=1 Tax=Anguilla anguilla TaxID=7936 RepID=A0A0E9UZE3_ANGAN
MHNKWLKSNMQATDTFSSLAESCEDLRLCGS